MQGSKDDEDDKCFYADQSGGSGKGSKSDEVGRSDTEGTKQTLHTAAEPAVHAAIKNLVSYRNDTKIAFLFAAS